MQVFRMIWSVLNTHQIRSAKILIALMILGVFLETIGIGLVFLLLKLLVQLDENKQENLIEDDRLSQWVNDFSQYLVGDNEMQLFFWVAIVVAGIYYFKSFLLGYLAFYQSKFTYGVQAYLSELLYSTYLKNNFDKTLCIEKSEIFRNATTDVAVFVGNGLTPGLMVLAEILVILGVSSLLLVLQPLTTIIAATIFMVVAVVLYVLTRINLKKWGAQRQDGESKRLQCLNEGISAIREIKLYQLERWLLSRYQKSNEEVASSTGKFQAMQAFPRITFELVLIHILFLYIGIALLNDISVATIFANASLFALAAFRLLPSVNRVLTSLQRIRYASPAIFTLGNIANQNRSNLRGINNLEIKKGRADISIDKSEGQKTDPIALKVAGLPASKKWHSLCLKGVSFNYGSEMPDILKGINLEIIKGSYVVLMGPSGSGKSTLADILLGLLPPTQGKLEYFDRQGNSIGSNCYQAGLRVGYVPQAVQLINDTFRRNIAFGEDDEIISEIKINSALKKAGLSEFLKKLPSGLDTMIGEGLVGMSGGERQRVGIARALYKEPDILVLDEPTSALDPDIEKNILKEIEKIKSEYEVTIFFITHKRAALEYSDIVFKIEDGKIKKLRQVA